jgi:hypothetical protein
LSRAGIVVGRRKEKLVGLDRKVLFHGGAGKDDATGCEIRKRIF